MKRRASTCKFEIPQKCSHPHKNSNNNGSTNISQKAVNNNNHSLITWMDRYSFFSIAYKSLQGMLRRSGRKLAPCERIGCWCGYVVGPGGQAVSFAGHFVTIIWTRGTPYSNECRQQHWTTRFIDFSPYMYKIQPVSANTLISIKAVSRFKINSLIFQFILVY